MTALTASSPPAIGGLAGGYLFRASTPHLGQHPVDRRRDQSGRRPGAPARDSSRMRRPGSPTGEPRLGSALEITLDSSPGSSASLFVALKLGFEALAPGYQSWLELVPAPDFRRRNNSEPSGSVSRNGLAPDSGWSSTPCCCPAPTRSQVTSQSPRVSTRDRLRCSRVPAPNQVAKEQQGVRLGTVKDRSSDWRR